MATLALAILVAATTALLVRWATQREVQTWLLAADGNRGRSDTGEWLDRFAMPPLRFANNVAAAAGSLPSGDHFHPRDLGGLNLQTLEGEIKRLSVGARAKDVLVCFLQTQCVSIEGQPYLLTADFQLPKELSDQAAAAEEGQTPRGAIALAELLESSASFPGRVVLLLDAGDVVADARIACPQNLFLSKLEEAVRATPRSNLYVVTSHSPGEISCDDFAGSRHFGRSLLEALGEPTNRGGESKDWGEDRYLSLGELAAYLHKRTASLSGLAQTPWLLRGDLGAVASDTRIWPEAEAVRLARLDGSGRPFGTPAATTGQPLAADAPATSTASTASANASPAVPAAPPAKAAAATPGSTPEADAAVALPKDPWVARWDELQQRWSDKIPPGHPEAWTLAECYPAQFRAGRAALLDAELRGRAGIGGGAAGEIGDAVGPPAAARDAAAPLAAIFPAEASAEARFNREELSEKRGQAQRLRALCRASLYAAELRQLAVRLDAIGGIDHPRITALVEAAERALPPERLSSSATAGLPANADVDPSLVRQALGELELLVARADQGRRLAESLLLCAALEPPQRQRVVAAIEATTRQSPADYPTMLPDRPPSWASYASYTPNDGQLLTTTDASPATDGFTGLIADAWTDGRDLASDLTSTSRPPRMALLPAPPRLQEQWWPQFTDISVHSGDSAKAELQLDPHPTPDSLRISLATLPPAIRAIRVGRQQITQQNLSATLPWKEVADRDGRVDLEIFAADVDSSTPASLRLELSSGGGAGPPSQNITLQTRVTGIERVELVAERMALVEGQRQWRAEPSLEPHQVLRLAPFAGHATDFRFSLRNHSDRKRDFAVSVYPLTEWPGLRGRIATDDGLLEGHPGLELSAQRARSASSAPIASGRVADIAPGDVGVVDFSAPAAAAEAASANPPASPALAAAAPAAAAAAGRDVSWGLMFEVREEGGRQQPERFFAEFLPTSASEYLEAEAVVTGDDAKSVVVTARYIGAANDGRPELAPADSAALQLSLHGESWMSEGFDSPPSGTLSGMIDPAANQFQARLQLQVPKAAEDVDELYLGLDVDGSPRVLSVRLSLTDTAPQPLRPYRRDTPRGRVMAVEADGRKYLRLRPAVVEEGAKIASMTGPMIFRTAAEVSVAAALDWASDELYGRSRETTVRLGSDGAFAPLYGDRSPTYTLLSADGQTLSIGAVVSDFSVQLQTGGYVNQAAPLKLQLSDGEEQVVGTVIFDNKPPAVSAELKSSVVELGKPAGVTMRVQDLAGVPPGGIKGAIRRAGTAAWGDLAASPQQRQVSRGEERWDIRIDTMDLAPGTYEVAFEAEDRAGNKSVKGAPLKLRVNPPPPPPPEPKPGDVEPPPPVTGTVTVQLAYGGGKQVSTQEASVILDSTGEKLTSSNGTFVFKDVPLGKGKFTAELTERGRLWKGEAEVNFKTPQDFKRPIPISVRISK